MAIYKDATQKPLTAKRNVLMYNPVRVNLHIDAADANTLWGYFNGPANPDSHFFVKKSGEVEQYRDTKYRANADLNGNLSTISIETASRGEGWNAAQVVAIVKLVAWICKAHNIPLKLATNSNPDSSSSHGISWHRLGVPHRGVYATRSLTSRPAGWLQSPSHLWYSTAQGKTCPGDANVALMPTILAGVKGGSVAPVAPAKPAPKPSAGAKPAAVWPNVVLTVPEPQVQHTTASHAAWVKLMNDVGFKDRSLTKNIQRWLANERGHHGNKKYYTGKVDGDFGGWTIQALQEFLRDKGLYKGLIDGRRVGYAARGPLTIRAEFAYLNAQRHTYK